MHAPNGDASATLARASPLSRPWRAFRRTGGFRTVELNIGGWSAVLAPGAAIGFVVGRLISRRVAATLAGSAVAWVLALVVDQIQWLRSGVAVDISSLSDQQWAAAHSELLRCGIEHHVETSTLDHEEEWRSVHSTMRHHNDLIDILHRHSPETH